MPPGDDPTADLPPPRTLDRVSIDLSESAATSPNAGVGGDAVRRYQVRTYGCQMNVHDSERISGLLEEAGYIPADSDDDADLVVFNTCAIRENADNKLYGNLSHLAPVKAARPGMQIAVGGCLAQKDKDAVLGRAPWVDVVFGTHNIGSLPVLLERARHNETAQVEIRDLEAFPPRCRPNANPLMPVGFRCRWAVTIPARSALFRRCAARRSIAGPAMCSPR